MFDETRELSDKMKITEMFGGERDFERIPPEFAENITLIPSEYDEIVKVLMNMISKGQILLMDKETCVPMTATGVVGYGNDKIIIFNER